MQIDAITLEKLSSIYSVEKLKTLSTEEIESLKLAYNLAKSNIKILKMDRVEYKALLKDRPLLRYKPIRNSFLCKGDKKLLALGLGIETKQVNSYIKNIIKNNFDIQKVNETLSPKQTQLDEDKLKMVQDYVYRHGKKDEALAWLDYELSNVKSVMQRLYQTLKKSSGGVYDYFERPCHLLDNQTACKMHKSIKYGLDNAQAQGYIDENVNKTACEWALRQIYDIQSNQTVREALKIEKYHG